METSCRGSRGMYDSSRNDQPTVYYGACQGIVLCHLSCNLSLERPISKLKYAFSSYLVVLQYGRSAIVFGLNCVC